MSKDIASLTSLRGIACLSVVAGHLSNASTKIPDIHSEMIGVLLFFCLSGFLLAYLYSNITDWQSLRNYAIRRFMRIYPAYSVVVILLGAYLFYHPHLQSRLISQPINPLAILSLQEAPWVLWSVRTELFFYAIFPFIAALIYVIHKILGKHFAVMGIVALIVLLSSMHHNAFRHVFPHERMMYHFFRSDEAFLVGVLAGYVYHFYAHVLQRYKAYITTCALILLLAYISSFPRVFLILYGFIPSKFYGVTVFNYALPLSVLMGLFILFVALSDRYRSYVFHNKVLIFFGKISFSLYLVHDFFIRLFLKTNMYNFSYETRIAVALVFSVCFAYSLYLLVEEPFIKLAKKLTKPCLPSASV